MSVGGVGGPRGGGPIGEAGANAAQFDGMLNDPNASGQDRMQFYLGLQQKMLEEQQAYQAISTVMKARYDSSTTAIRNFK
jgi:hypothetical protein